MASCFLVICQVCLVTRIIGKQFWIVLTTLEGTEQHRVDLIHEVNQIWPKFYDCLSMEKQISKIKAKLPFPLGPVTAASVSGSRLPDRQIPSPSGRLMNYSKFLNKSRNTAPLRTHSQSTFSSLSTPSERNKTESFTGCSERVELTQKVDLWRMEWEAL